MAISYRFDLEREFPGEHFGVGDLCLLNMISDVNNLRLARYFPSNSIIGMCFEIANNGAEPVSNRSEDNLK